MNPLQRLYHFYFDSFIGLSREVWILSLITFVNRAGTMVVPFLTIYLTEDMHLNLTQVGWIMSSFGLGSVIGSWIGGKLTDKFGHRPVMLVALSLTGIAFILLQFADNFTSFCIGIFFLMVIADTFRPAIFVALRDYATQETRTRAVTLVRLAINLGFSLGPAIGGLIITLWSYSGLFWTDGISCMLAALLLIKLLPRTETSALASAEKKGATKSPYTDKPYLLFLFASVLISIPFVQYFSAVPLFYREVHLLSELHIGLILGFNGLLIFLVEMPLIKYCEEKNYGIYGLIVFSIFLMILSFASFEIAPTVALLWIGMTFVTIGEMINFPFMNRYAYDRSDLGPPGAYMALFTISWSIAHIFGHTMGLHIIDTYGYSATWWVCICFLLVSMAAILLLKNAMKNEAKSTGGIQEP